MAVNLRNRSFTKELDYTPEELKFLIKLAMDLKAAKYGGYEQPRLKGKEIALFNIDGEFFALDNLCTHEEGPLAEGEVEGYEVTCPWHGAKFDIRTGEVLQDPAYEDVARHNVRVTGSDIEVEI